MKKFLFLFILLTNLTPIFGQVNSGADAVVVNSNPPVTRKMLDSYVRFIEWHFELKLTPEDRGRFENLLIEDLKRGYLVSDVKTNFETMEKVRTQGTWLALAEFHKSNVSEDESNRMIEGLRGDGKIYGDGMRSQTMREAEKGYASSKFLMSVLPEYEKPIIDKGSYQTSLYRNYVDALYDFSTYKMEMVTGKKIERSEAARRQFQDRLIATWNDPKVDRTDLYFWIIGIRNDWLIWRAADFNFYDRMTTFRKKEQLLEWGQDLLKVSAQVKPFLEQRFREYKDYVNKMPNSEVAAEIKSKQDRDREFEFAMQKLKIQQQQSQAAYQTMRNALLTAHVINLNISENIGNTGYVWVLK